ncbi:hypothetical protein DPEC_G00206060 [Dallia pectoralis]|uniref:Uncharacterized protein n=1 Tax=Dallia pectoralis TaxID=75939 RepID=A0ACC2G4J5_DALPE|nr:hypothetical protein DPEC_G00206060 [Dallia pectoralis]
MAPPPTSSSINLSHLTQAPVGTIIPIKRTLRLTGHRDHNSVVLGAHPLSKPEQKGPTSNLTGSVSGGIHHPEQNKKASVPALTPQPLSVSAAPAQPPLYSKLEDLEISPTGFDPPSTSTPFHHPTCIVSPEQASQPAPMTTRSGRSGDPD